MSTFVKALLLAVPLYFRSVSLPSLPDNGGGRRGLVCPTNAKMHFLRGWGVVCLQPATNLSVFAHTRGYSFSARYLFFSGYVTENGWFTPNYFWGIDEENARKTSVLRGRIPSVVCNRTKHEVFHSVFPSKINQVMWQRLFSYYIICFLKKQVFYFINKLETLYSSNASWIITGEYTLLYKR